MKNDKLKIIIFSAMVLSISTILSLFQINVLWINGGNITFFSLVPLSILCYKYKRRYAFLACFCFSLIQFFLGMNTFKGLNLVSYFFGFLFDYVLAYSSLVFCSFFKGVYKDEISFMLGCTISMILKFLSHFISGIFIWSSILTGNIGVIFYSFMYNVSYMLPESLMTVCGSYFVMKYLKKGDFFER